MARNLAVQQGNQPRIHERIIIGNVEANDVRTAQVLLKPLLQFAAVAAFHHENQIGFFNHVARYRIIRVAIHTSR